MPPEAEARHKFFVEIIKPSHYDDDGYVIQWLRAFLPSNSLACLYALTLDVQRRQALGANVEVVVHAHEESHTVIPVRGIIRRIRAGGGRGVVLLVGVQSNQFPRAVDLAQEFRAAGLPVAVGGFHVSGCLAMLPDLPADLRAAQEQGITLFAGEAEGRLEQVLSDAYHGRLRPLYNFMDDLPDLRGQVVPALPRHVLRGYMLESPFDAGRGCPFQCSFCTIINVQGRKSRYRDADDVERVIRQNLALGIRKFFITDDDFARNKNWEAIFDRLIALRENEGLHIKFLMQVDTQCHKIPRFIDKAARAGCSRVFLGLETVNPENLAAARKHQNHVGQYRAMLQAWRRHRVVTVAGYILGFPADTPESIERDIRTIQRELPIDVLEFFVLTPLPGSADHQALHRQGVPMEPDMNRYDVEHVTTAHPRMSANQWRAVYDRAWHLYYSPQHVETLLRRAKASGIKTGRMIWSILCYYGSYRFEKVHPLQCGIVRRKIRTTRRPGLPREHPLLFYPRRLVETVATFVGLGAYWLWLERLRRRVERDPRAAAYTDAALAGPLPPTIAQGEPTRNSSPNSAPAAAVA
jgi:pyruvate-formate lyase-activating enzyme